MSVLVCDTPCCSVLTVKQDICGDTFDTCQAPSKIRALRLPQQALKEQKNSHGRLSARSDCDWEAHGRGVSTTIPAGYSAVNTACTIRAC
eukprot:627153-Amphidinium_carterae.1